ncbi:thermonuclease family protein [Stappia sp. F7233]|uniref:Thermonuclease family protein n=1 Tax=Stappia albiluteola TaxID=2758565 RepID=A0A839AIV9_9HYPH|nr:thermonuclease family protein [Stappia albiluteola]MBA5778697.1 thermonuclease family protein [Stappia albiluteola]
MRARSPSRSPFAVCAIAAIVLQSLSSVPSRAGAQGECLLALENQTGEGGRLLDVATIDAGGTVRGANGTNFRQTDLVFRPEAKFGPDAPEIAANSLLFQPVAASGDRWGRQVGNLIESETGAPIALTWIMAGRAIVAPEALPLNCLDMLLAAETDAREKRRGLWRTEKIFWAGDPALEERAGQFTLVEGRLLSIGQAGKTHYLNFGRDWSSDFTATIDTKQKSAFDAAGIDLAALKGKRVRLRGVIVRDRGPAIRLEHTAQIELKDKGISGETAWRPSNKRAVADNRSKPSKQTATAR